MTTKARELETREFTERVKVWKPAELLPEPIKQAGYKYRWIRPKKSISETERRLGASRY